MQLGWKNNIYYLFLFNMDNGKDKVETLKQRFNKIVKCLKTARVVFGSKIIKKLPQLTITYLYNYLMNIVD